MKNNVVRGIAKAAVVTGALVLSYAMGDRIGRVVEEDDSIDAEDKPVVTVVSCTLSGYTIGLIARHIVKKI